MGRVREWNAVGNNQIGQVGPRGEWGRVGPKQGRLVLSGVGEGLGMHWDSIKLL